MGVTVTLMISVGTFYCLRVTWFPYTLTALHAALNICCCGRNVLCPRSAQFISQQRLTTERSELIYKKFKIKIVNKDNKHWFQETSMNVYPIYVDNESSYGTPNFTKRTTPQSTTL